ncbi:hypothetical protein Hanom_Chr10g00948691 [Helianthus anomalus]
MWMGARQVGQSFIIAFYVGFCCLFASFVLLSSFNPVYSKGTKTQAFSNVSTRKWLIFLLI